MSPAGTGSSKVLEEIAIHLSTYHSFLSQEVANRISKVAQQFVYKYLLHRIRASETLDTSALHITDTTPVFFRVLPSSSF
jgi:hypothetical protein